MYLIGIILGAMFVAGVCIYDACKRAPLDPDTDRYTYDK